MTTNEGAFYYPPLEDLPIFDVLVFRNAQKVIDLAINSDNTFITNTTSGATYYPTFVDSSSGYERIRTNAPTYTYNANTNTLSANTSGSSGSASTIALTSDDTSGTYWIPFSKTTSATSNTLFIDNTVTPLSYNPFTSILTATTFSGNATTASTAALATQVTLSNTASGATNYLIMSTTNSGTSSLLTDTAGATYDSTTNTAAINISGNAGTATSANTIIVTDDNSNSTFYPIFTTSAGFSKTLYYDITTTALSYNPFTSTLTAANIVGNTATFTTNAFSPSSTISIIDSGTGNSINFLPNAGVGAFNFLTEVGDSLIMIGGLNVGDLTIAPYSSTLSGIRLTPTTTFIGVGGASTTRTAGVSCSGTTVAITGLLTATNFTGLASNASQVLVTDNDTATLYYPTFATAGTGQKSLLFDSTTNPLSYQPSTSTLTATTFSGNATTASTAALATQVTLSNTATGASNFLVMSTTNSGTSSLLTDNSGATYDSTTNTAAINISGNATSATNATTSANIALTGDNTSGTYFIPFSKTTSATSNALFIDNTITPLVYNPSNNELSATQFSLGGLAPATGANAGLFAQNIGSSATIIQNQATSGSIFLNTRTALNALTTVLSISTTAATFSSTAIFNGPNISVSGTTINLGQGAGGVSNLLIGASVPRTIVFTTGANTLVGNQAGQNMTVAAANNTCLGAASGPGTTSGTQNTFIGAVTGFQTANGTGSDNTCVGFQAGLNLTTTANQNTLIGGFTSDIRTGAGNTVIGFGAASALQNGNNNVIIGLQAGDNITGSDNICIGDNATVPTAGNSNQIAIGTATETMFIRGALNYRIGATFTPTGTNQTFNLSTVPIAQFYIVNIAFTGCVIVLEAPSNARCVGSIVTFKRKTGNVAFTIDSASPLNYFLGVGTLAISSTISVAAGVFQTSFISDGITWCEINRT